MLRSGHLAYLASLMIGFPRYDSSWRTAARLSSSRQTARQPAARQGMQVRQVDPRRCRGPTESG